MPATIRDVAARAGVAPSTVSKALGGSGAVSEETLRRIQRAVKDLGYQPNARARSFATRASRQVMFLADFPFDAAFVNPHLFEIMRGAQHTLDKKGYTLAMKQARPGEAAEFTEQLVGERMADGIIFHASVLTKRLAARIVRLGVPHIVIGKPNFDSSLCWIDTNNSLSGEIAAGHLLEQGFRDIAFVGGRADDMISWNRLRGVRTALSDAGVELTSDHVLQTNSTIMDGVRAFKRLARLHPRPRAIICANNPLAMGCLEGALQKGLRVPDDVAFITFDTYPFSLYTEPQLTVVNINMYDMGQEAGRMILQKIRHPGMQIQSFTTVQELIRRGTT